MSFSSNKVRPNNIDIDSSQTLSNKTLDNTTVIETGADIQAPAIIDPTRSDVKKDTLANLQTYASTATNGQLCFATDTKKLFQIKDSALAEVGSGQGGINYLAGDSSNLESSIGDWVEEDLNLKATRTEPDALRGSASLTIGKGTVDASTERVSCPFTVDKADLAKKLTISFDTSSLSAAYADGDFRVIIIQDPAGTPSDIRVNGEDIKAGDGVHYAQFQTDATELDYALAIECVASDTDEKNVRIDNIQVGPREVAMGAMVTDWEDFTPSNTQGLGTITSNNLEYRRVGDTLEIRGYFTTGTVAASEARIELPNSLSIKAGTSTAFVGQIKRTTVSGNYDWGLLATDGDTYLNIGRQSAVTHIHTVQLGNALFNSTERLSLEASIPIQGWSSNAVSSEDLGGRDLNFRAVMTNTQGIPHGTNTTVLYNIVDYDTISGYNPANGKYTIPETGYYDIRATLFMGSFNVGVGQAYNSFIVVDGSSQISESRDEAISGDNTTHTIQYQNSTEYYLEKGQTVEFQVYHGAGITVNTNTVGQRSVFSISKKASPQTILETETVAARYTSNSGQAMAVYPYAPIYEDLDYDTHNAYNSSTGDYTVPVSGKYTIKAKYYATGSFTAGDNINIIARVDSVDTEGATVRMDSTITNYFMVQLDTTLELEKGQVIDFTVANTGAGTVTWLSNSIYNTFSIARIK